MRSHSTAPRRAARLLLLVSALALATQARAEEDAPEAEANGIPWVRDHAEAREQAKKEGKGILAYLTPSWFH